MYDQSNDVAPQRMTKSQVLNTALVHKQADIDGIDQFKNHAKEVPVSSSKSKEMEQYGSISTVINETITFDDSINAENVSKRGDYF